CTSPSCRCRTASRELCGDGAASSPRRCQRGLMRGAGMTHLSWRRDSRGAINLPLLFYVLAVSGIVIGAAVCVYMPKLEYKKTRGPSRLKELEARQVVCQKDISRLKETNSRLQKEGSNLWLDFLPLVAEQIHENKRMMDKAPENTRRFMRMGGTMEDRSLTER